MPTSEYGTETEKFVHEDENLRDHLKILVLKVRFANHLADADRWSKEDLRIVFNEDIQKFYQMGTHNHLSDLEADVCLVELTHVPARGDDPSETPTPLGNIDSQDNLRLWSGSVQHETHAILRAALLKLEEQFESDKTDCIDSSGAVLSSTEEASTFEEFLSPYKEKRGHMIYMSINGPDCRAAQRYLYYKNDNLNLSAGLKFKINPNTGFKYAYSCDAKGMGSLGFYPENAKMPTKSCRYDPSTHMYPEPECLVPHFELFDETGTGIGDEVEFKWVIPVGWTGDPDPDYSTYPWASSGASKLAGDDSRVLKTFVHEIGHMMGISHTTTGYNNPFAVMASAQPAQFTSYSMLDPDVNWLSPEVIEEIEPPEDTTTIVNQEINLWFLEDWNYEDESTPETRVTKIPIRDSHVIKEVKYPLETEIVETGYLLIEARTWNIGTTSSGKFGDEPTSASDYWHCSNHDGHYEYLPGDPDCLAYHQDPFPISGTNNAPQGFSIPDEGVLISIINLSKGDGEYPGGQDAGAVTPVDTTPGDGLNLDALLDKGESFQLKINGKEITVEVMDDIKDAVSGVRFGYKVKITLKFVGGGDPELKLPKNTLNEEGNLTFDGPWYSPNMWVDSEIYGGFCVEDNIHSPTVLEEALDASGDKCIENMESEDENTKFIGGDTPKLGQQNKICLTAFNGAVSTYYSATDHGAAKVKFWWRSHNTGFGTDSFSFVDEINFPDLNAGELTNLCVDWVPVLDEKLVNENVNSDGLVNVHACVMVKMYVDSNQNGTFDDIAVQGFQENFGYFTTTMGSPYHPVEHSFEVYNPYSNSTLIWLDVFGLESESGWSYELDWYNRNISGHDFRMNTITVIPPQDSAFSSQSYVPLDPVEVDIRAYTMTVASDDEMLVREIGGIVMKVVPSQKTTITHQNPDTVIQLGELVTMAGVVTNSIPETNVAALFTTPSGEVFVQTTIVDRNGYFSLGVSPYRLSNESGNWTVQLSYLGAQAVAGISSGVTTFEVLPRNIRETRTIDVGTIFDIRGSVDPDLGFSDNRMQITYTSPAGEITTRETQIQENGNYSDDFEFSEQGEWRVDYSYMDENGFTVQFSQSIEVLEVAEDGDSSSSLALFLLAIAALCVLIVVAVKSRRES